MNGTPGSEKPSMLKSPEWSCNSYQTPGTRCGRCMSFESSGFPETVCAPETTQLFDPGRQASQASGGSIPEREPCATDSPRSPFWPEGQSPGKGRVMTPARRAALIVLPRVGWPVAAELPGNPASPAGGRSRHESGG